MAGNHIIESGLQARPPLLLLFATTSLDYRPHRLQIASTPRKDFAIVDQFSELLRARASPKRCPDSNSASGCGRIREWSKSGRQTRETGSLFRVKLVNACRLVSAW